MHLQRIIEIAIAIAIALALTLLSWAPPAMAEPGMFVEPEVEVLHVFGSPGGGWSWMLGIGMVLAWRRRPSAHPRLIPREETTLPTPITPATGPTVGLVLALASCTPSFVTEVGAADGSGSGDDQTHGGSTHATTGASTTGTSEQADSTGDTPPAAWCLRGVAQPDLGGTHDVLAIQDADGDGRDEVWVAQALWDPVGELQSTRLLAYQLGDAEVLEAIIDVVREGEALAMTDIDGDGVLDVLMRQWNQPDAWWLAGLPDATVDLMMQPLDLPGSRAYWMDANGDGQSDALVRFDSPTTGIALHLGDGAGGFAQTDALDSSMVRGSVYAWPGGIAGRLVVGFVSPSFGFSSDDVTLMGIEVSSAGEIGVLAQSAPLEITVRHVGDADGDAIPDVLGFDAVVGQGLIYVHQGPPGQYIDEHVELEAKVMVVAPLTGDDELDVVYSSTADEVFLRRREGGGWPSAIPLTLDGPWTTSAVLQPLQADGEPGMEILGRPYGRDMAPQLWRVEPCDRT